MTEMKTCLQPGTNILAWNTGRFYGKSGQRMAAACVRMESFPYGGIVFTDIDRGITGFIVGGSESLRKDAVMSAYDHCLYVSVSEYEFRAVAACREAAAKVEALAERVRF